MALDNGRLIELTTNRDVVAVHWAGGIKQAFELVDPRAWRLAHFRSGYLKRGKRRLAAKAA